MMNAKDPNGCATAAGDEYARAHLSNEAGHSAMNNLGLF